MIVVIPSEKSATVGPGVLKTAEPIGEVRPVLEGSELRFTVRAVVTYMRSAVGFGDPEIGQQVGHRLGDHR